MTKPINISVPDGLYKDVKEYSQIQISAVCQKALQDAVKEEKSKSVDMDLVSFGAMRTMKYFKNNSEINIDDYIDHARKASQNWVATEATEEQLRKSFITPTDLGRGNFQPGHSQYVIEAFLSSSFAQQLPIKYLKEAEDWEGDILQAWIEEAYKCWNQIKDKLESKGYEVS
jgi:hypothetical protein